MIHNEDSDYIDRQQLLTNTTTQRRQRLYRSATTILSNRTAEDLFCHHSDFRLPHTFARGDREPPHMDKSAASPYAGGEAKHLSHKMQKVFKLGGGSNTCYPSHSTQRCHWVEWLDKACLIKEKSLTKLLNCDDNEMVRRLQRPQRWGEVLR